MRRDSVRVLPKKVNWRRLMGLASCCTHLRVGRVSWRAASLWTCEWAYSSSAEDGRHVGATAAAWALLRCSLGSKRGGGALQRALACRGHSASGLLAMVMAGGALRAQEHQGGELRARRLAHDDELRSPAARVQPRRPG